MGPTADAPVPDLGSAPRHDRFPEFSAEELARIADGAGEPHATSVADLVSAV